MHAYSLRAARALLALSCGCASAQTASSLAPIVVTGNPLGADQVAAPAESLSGDSLVLRSQSSLGETLNTLPGISSTYFGPVASRPVIRGLDGDRIRILGNSASLSDVSSLSYDHAVSADPITVERIEVLRGPAALLYGGNAIGGVVNLIDNRIPRQAPESFLGKLDAGYASGNREKSGAMLLEGGNRRWGVHVDAFSRHAADVAVPAALPCKREGVAAVGPRICNSSARAQGGALGGSVFLDEGHIGMSTSSFQSLYGAVSEDEVAIRMRSVRHAFEGQWRKLGGPIQELRVQGSHRDYRHAEEEGGEVGTLFRQRGTDLRIEARHRPWGKLSGVWGIQLDGTRFSAEGEEAFAPPSRTRQAAVFAYEEWAAPWGKLTAGLRAERVRVEAFESAGSPRFTPRQRSFAPASGALGFVWNAAPSWQVTGQLAHSERAPKDYELFADGPHVATGAYELGDPQLGLERSRNMEAGLQWGEGVNKARVAAYATRFTNYVALSPTGAVQDGLPQFAYRGTRASFRGFEASADLSLVDGPTRLDLALRADHVRAHDKGSGEPLARISPARFGADFTLSRGRWSAMLGSDWHASQQRVPQGAVPTAGYALVRAAVTWRVDAPAASVLWYLRVNNAADRLAYSATSILTQTAPGRVPLPGRSVKLGLQASF